MSDITTRLPSKTKIELGYCECGCGQPAPIAKRNDKRFGHVKGEPLRFINRHHAAKPRPPVDSTELQPSTSAIPLTQGKVALVDASDYDVLNQYKWYAREDKRAWYAVRNVPIGDGKRTIIFMHAVLLGAKGVDHVNGNGLDNRRSNLRPATPQENQFNTKPRGGTSVFKGVAWDKRVKKWRAYISIGGRRTHLGLFDDELKAATAYDIKARELFGEFAWLNFKKHIYPSGDNR